MSLAPVSLEELQHWMQAVVTHPGGVRECAAPGSLVDHPSDEALARVVSGSQSLGHRERLEIYQRAYFSRLLECLRQDYPVVAKAIGDELFDAFALGFLHEHPPTSYTLARLGAAFPEYLAATCPPSRDDENSEPPWPRFLIDLAWLEQAVNEVYDGPGAENRPLLLLDRLQRISDEDWPKARLVCNPSLKLLCLDHPVNECFTAISRSDAYEIPAGDPSFVAVVRRNYRVSRHDLSSMQHSLLSALVEGMPIGEAIATAFGREASDHSMAGIDDDASNVRRWFHDWTAAGFFLEVHLA